MSERMDIRTKDKKKRGLQGNCRKKSKKRNKTMEAEKQIE